MQDEALEGVEFRNFSSTKERTINETVALIGYNEMFLRHKESHPMIVHNLVVHHPLIGDVCRVELSKVKHAEIHTIIRLNDQVGLIYIDYFNGSYCAEFPRLVEFRSILNARPIFCYHTAIGHIRADEDQHVLLFTDRAMLHEPVVRVVTKGVGPVKSTSFTVYTDKRVVSKDSVII